MGLEVAVVVVVVIVVTFMFYPSLSGCLTTFLCLHTYSNHVSTAM